MHDVVARAKFQREVDNIRSYIAAERAGYRWKLLRAEGSRIVVEMEHPGHDPLVMRVLANDWDQKPASYRFVDGSDPSYNHILSPERWPGAPFQDHHRGPFRDDHRRVGDPR